jgi:hypothetical protein
MLVRLRREDDETLSYASPQTVCDYSICLAVAKHLRGLTHPVCVPFNGLFSLNAIKGLSGIFFYENSNIYVWSFVVLLFVFLRPIFVRGRVTFVSNVLLP